MDRPPSTWLVEFASGTIRFPYCYGSFVTPFLLDFWIFGQGISRRFDGSFYFIRGKNEKNIGQELNPSSPMMERMENFQYIYDKNIYDSLDCSCHFFFLSSLAQQEFRFNRVCKNLYGRGKEEDRV